MIRIKKSNALFGALIATCLLLPMAIEAQNGRVGIKRKLATYQVQGEEKNGGVFPPSNDPNGQGVIVGQRWEGERGVTETVAEIMQRDAMEPEVLTLTRTAKPKHVDRDRSTLPQNPLSPAVASWPPAKKAAPTTGSDVIRDGQAHAAFTPGTSFLGPQVSESGAIPPDTVFDVGPTQILVCVNDRIKVYDKNGVVGGLNTTTNTFFNSVRNGTGTTDPRVRYDRRSGRWFVIMSNLSQPNRIMIAVSSGSTITSTASFTFFFFQQDTVAPAGNTNQFADYPTLGVDANGLYIGANMFTTTFQGTSAWYVPKANLLSGGPIVAYAFRNLTGSAGGAGPYTPQGVNNDEPSATEGYFLGVDNATFGTLMMRRMTFPGGVPTLSANISVAVSTTTSPEHPRPLGSNFTLDALEDRLFAAQIHRPKGAASLSILTAHNIEVNSAGVASSSGSRTGTRWYEIGNLSGTPNVVQSGTIFDSSATPDSYWIPTIMRNNQNHMAAGFSAGSHAATSRRAEIGVTSRLATDTLGAMAAVTIAQTSTTNYNVEANAQQRWGDYSFTSLDPQDGMTLWTAQEYCNATNSWAVRVIKLVAPPPATIVNPGNVVLTRGATQNIVVTGTSSGGSGFFDPDASFPNRIAASISGSGVTVNSVTYNSPTQVTLNVTTSFTALTGVRNLTITNPDGQTNTATNYFDVRNPIPTLASISPNSATAGGAGFTLNLTGTNFVTGCTVNWNGSPRTTTFISNTSLQATINAADIAAAGSIPVTVTNPVPGGGTSNSQTFTINPGASFVNPNTMLTWTGTTLVATLANVFSSDDLYYDVLSAAPLNKIQIEANGTSTVQTPSALRVDFESRVDQQNLKLTVEAFNYSTNQWVTIFSNKATMKDQTQQIVLSSPASYVQAGTLKMATRMTWTSISNQGMTTPRYKSSTDVVKWFVTP